MSNHVSYSCLLESHWYRPPWTSWSNSASNWLQNVLILPGNCVEFSLETASLYAQDPHNNRYGFKCLVVGYDNPTAVSPHSPSPAISF